MVPGVQPAKTKKEEKAAAPALDVGFSAQIFWADISEAEAGPVEIEGDGLGFDDFETSIIEDFLGTLSGVLGEAPALSGFQCRSTTRSSLRRRRTTWSGLRAGRTTSW